MATSNESFNKPPAEELTNEPIPQNIARAKVAVKAALPTKSVLIIIDDNDVHFGDDQSAQTFMLAFKKMGYKVRIEESKDTSYSTWEKFDIVVWSCGDDYSAINDIKYKYRQMLVDYVVKGGRLLLESGNIAAWNRESVGATILNREFREKVLHATTDWVYHDVGNLILKTEHPIANTPNELPDTIGFIPTESGDGSGDANAVRTLSDATGVYGWSYVAYGGKLVNESVANNSYGLIASEIKDGGRVVYFAFDIDDIDNPDIQQKLIQNSENWLR